MTKNGVEYDLKESPYVVSLLSGLILFFSSRFHLDKFCELRDENREKISKSLSKRFNIKIDGGLISDITLYIACENRGFYFVYKGVKYESKEEVSIIELLEINKCKLDKYVV